MLSTALSSLLASDGYLEPDRVPRPCLLPTVPL